MIDMTDTIAAKSDQMNFIDLSGGPKTVAITGVKKVSGDQPIHIICDDDKKKPWKPCKNMRRIMVQIWGKDGDKYVGQKVTLYNDESVRWSGKELGGIRISHATGIENAFKVMLPISRGQFAPFTIQPIITEPLNVLTDLGYSTFCADLASATTMAELQSIGKRIKAGRFDEDGCDKLGGAYKESVEAVRAAGE